MQSQDLGYDLITTDVLIIGAGAAGLRAAIELSRGGVDTLVVGKSPHGDAHTVWAAGGINASLGTRDPEDRWEIHAADTIGEGHYVTDPLAVETLAREAPERIRELHELGEYLTANMDSLPRSNPDEADVVSHFADLDA